MSSIRDFFKSHYLDKIYLFDVYYNRTFLKNLFLFVSLFIVVYFFSLFLTQLPEHMKKASYNDFVTPKNILMYYFYLIPNYINFTIPFSFLFSLTYTLTLFYSSNEILSLISSGVSTFRISFFSLLTALCTSILLVILNTSLFPNLLSKADDYDKKLNLVSSERYIKNIQFRDNEGFLYFAQYFLEEEKALQDVLVLKENFTCTDFNLSKNFLRENFQKDKVVKIIEELFKKQTDIPDCFPFYWYLRGDKLIYNDQTKGWSINNFIKVEFNQKTKSISSFTKQEGTKFLPELKIPLDFLVQEKKTTETLTLKEAIEQYKQMKVHLEPTYEFEIDVLDQKILHPLQVFFLAVFASTLGRFFSRKHLFVSSLIYSFCIGFVFFVLVNIGYSLGKSKVFPVSLSVSFGYLIGIILFIYFFKRKMS